MLEGFRGKIAVRWNSMVSLLKNLRINSAVRRRFFKLTLHINDLLFAGHFLRSSTRKTRKNPLFQLF